MKRFLVAAAALSACGLHAFNNDSGGAINLAAAGEFVLAARGAGGLDVIRAVDGSRVFHLDPGGESDSYDDLSAEGERLVVLDGDSGRLSSFRLSTDGSLTALSRDQPVDSSPYSGVSLSGGRVVVSGGTCGVASFTLDAQGRFSAPSTLRAARGQPEVTMLPGGRGALLSTHFSGSSSEFVDGAEFGVSSLRLDPMSIASARGLPGAGFTEGGGRPSSWPVRASVRGELAYVAHGGGLDVIRVGAELSLTRLSHTALPMRGVEVSVRDERAYVVGASPALMVVLDVSDPAAPRVLRQEPVTEAGARPAAVYVSESWVYIAAGPAGLLRRER